MAWQISGQYFETCNCTVLCPCILTRAKAQPTEDHCDVVMAFSVQHGSFDQVELAGLNAVVVAQTDGPMADGKGRREVYLDSRATDSQRQALEAIFRGEAGGPPAALAQMAPDFLGVTFAPIDFQLEGDSRRVRVGEVGDLTVAGLPGRYQDGTSMSLANTTHPVNRDLALAKAGERAHFKDAAFDFDNAGRNGHFAPFDWKNEGRA